MTTDMATVSGGVYGPSSTEERDLILECFICDFVYYSEHRIDMTQLIVGDLWEAFEWMEETFMELHLDSNPTPDLLRLRRDDEILAAWETHFDAVR